MSRFTRRAQEPFVGRRLIIPSYLTPGRMVIGIQVGKNSQLAGSGGIPAEVFAETAFDTGVYWDEAPVGMEIGITALGAAPLPVAIIGDTRRRRRRIL